MVSNYASVKIGFLAVNVERPATGTPLGVSPAAARRQVHPSCQAGEDSETEREKKQKQT